MLKHLAANEHRGCGFDPGSGRSPTGGSDNPLQYSCLKKIPWTDEPGVQAAVRTVAKNRIRLSN